MPDSSTLPDPSEPRPGSALYNALTPCLSSPRLKSYRRKGESELDALTFYNWNLCLCEALYPSLQNLEITFRNRLHHAFTQEFGEYWMWNDPPLFREDDKDQILAAETRLTKDRKPAEPPRMVAELTFGFWTRLLDRRFERVLWPKLLKPVFPFIPSKLRTRDTISAHFEVIRRLRNRISHHEPIWKSNLLDEHAKIVEAIQWLSPEMATLTKNCDRFSAVHTSTFKNVLRAKIEQQSLQIHLSTRIQSD